MQRTAVRTPARFSLTAVALAAALAQAAFANEQKHEEVVVTATRTEANARDVLADVTVIDREQIDSIAPGRSIGEVLQRFAGVQFNSNGGRGNSQGVSIRGAGGGYILLLIDGVRYGSLTLVVCTVRGGISKVVPGWIQAAVKNGVRLRSSSRLAQGKRSV